MKSILVNIAIKMKYFILIIYYPLDTRLYLNRDSNRLMWGSLTDFCHNQSTPTCLRFNVFKLGEFEMIRWEN